MLKLLYGLLIAHPKPFCSIKNGLGLMVLMAVLGLTAPPLFAQSTSVAQVEGAQISLQRAPLMAPALLQPAVTLGDNQTLVFLNIALEEGWKTYWRLPGRFGLAPSFDWQASDNLLQADSVFPAPRLFDEGDGVSIGYDSPTVWPIVITRQMIDQPTTVHLQLDIGLCEVLCLPEQVTVSISLPPALDSTPAPQGEHQELALSTIMAVQSSLPTYDSGPHPSTQIRRAQTGHTVSIVPPSVGFYVLEGQGSRHRLVAADQTSPARQRGEIVQMDWPYQEPPNALTHIIPGQSATQFTLTVVD